MGRVKKYIWLIILTLFIAIALFLGLYLSRGALDPGFALRFKINGNQTIECWEQDDEHVYVFLPSYAETDKVSVDISGSDKIFWGGVQLVNGSDLGDFEIDKEYELTINDRKAKKLTILRSANVATMFIETASGSMDNVHNDKEHKEKALITLYTANGDLDYKSDYKDKIRGHGNATWEMEKKPYNIYLERSAGLLGMNGASKWILLANAYDETNLRSKLINDFIKKTEPYEGFSTECEFVDLYLNGEYRGLYLCCPDTAANMNNTIGDDIEYFFGTASASQVKASDTNNFEINTGAWIEVKLPDICSKDKLKSLKSYLKEMQSVLLNDDGSPQTNKNWEDYIDLDSWARKYLIEEIFLNCDTAGSQNFYIGKKSEKIYIGTCWDYDGTLGSVAYMSDPHCFVANRDWVDQGRYTPWYNALWKKEKFRSYVIDLYKTTFLSSLTDLTDNDIPDGAALIAKASENNALRWGSDWKASYEYMVAFLRERIDFLNSAWIDGVDYKTVMIKGVGASCYYTAVYGTKCEDLPSPEERGVQYMTQWGLDKNNWEGQTTWYYEGTDQPFDQNTVITEDIVLYTKANASNVSVNGTPSVKLIFIVCGVVGIAGLFVILIMIDIRRQRGMKK